MEGILCRSCHLAMEHGGVYSGRWIRWLADGAKPPRGYGQFDDDQLLGVSWTKLRPLVAEAHRCSACRIVEFKY